jgi:hypothetical protein
VHRVRSLHHLHVRFTRLWIRVDECFFATTMTAYFNGMPCITDVYAP